MPSPVRGASPPLADLPVAGAAAPATAPVASAVKGGNRSCAWRSLGCNHRSKGSASKSASSLEQAHARMNSGSRSQDRATAASPDDTAGASRPAARIPSGGPAWLASAPLPTPWATGVLGVLTGDPASPTPMATDKPAAPAAATSVPAVWALMMRANAAASAPGGAAREASAKTGRKPKPVPREVRMVWDSSAHVAGRVGPAGLFWAGLFWEGLYWEGLCSEGLFRAWGSRTSSRPASASARATAPTQKAGTGGGASRSYSAAANTMPTPRLSPELTASKLGGRSSAEEYK
mmetsp:Transcript_34697/g.111975  ORF Transcript_34697/g.111975 Transcript_34697/m.111975 type:complete len:291 (+) Transcript_34697:177-1049(+)